MLVVFFFSLSANQREKQGEIFIPEVKMCPLKGESANCLSAIQSVIYESLTSDSPGKVKSSVNQSCPLINASVNQRVDCSLFQFLLLGFSKLPSVKVTNKHSVKKMLLKISEKFARKYHYLYPNLFSFNVEVNK